MLERNSNRFTRQLSCDKALAYSVEILLHELGARLTLQELHVLLELERSDLILSANWDPQEGTCDRTSFALSD